MVSLTRGSSGAFTVTLTVTDTATGEWDVLTRTNYVTVPPTVITYDYDPLYRLTSAAYSDTQAYTYTYVYDEVGNRTAMTKTITSTVAFTHVYEYDDGDRPALSGVEGLTKVDDQTYTWDANGNLLNDGTRTLILRQRCEQCFPTHQYAGDCLVKSNHCWLHCGMWPAFG